jgi:DNA-directed RNA polymerase subunit F
MVKKILEERTISIPEVKEILDDVVGNKFVKMDMKTDPFTEATQYYVDTFSKMSADSARKIRKMLVKEGFSESLANQMINIAPDQPQELRTIIEGAKDPSLNEKFKEEKDLVILIQKFKDLY